MEPSDSLSPTLSPLLARPTRSIRQLFLTASAIAVCATVGNAQESRPTVHTVYQAGLAAGDATLVPVPQLGGSPAAATAGSGTSVSLGAPGFDPYATGPPAASVPPTLSGAPTTPYGTTTPPNWGVPSWNAATTPATAPTFPVYPSPNTPTMSGVPGQQPVMFPNGLAMPPEASEYLRLFQDTRLRYTFLAGESAQDKMQSNDIELATTLNLPNFLWTNRPLHVSPTFIGHYWSGPVNVNPALVNDGTGLPSKAYSAFLNLRWQPMITPTFGGDIDFSFGGFSDYDTFVTDSWRFYGTGVFVAALTPTMTLKGGINYLDRYSIKMLPAFGVLWTPNPKTRFDIFFPKPKLAQYLTTMGNTDVWWYLMGEYGGGSWTIERGIPGDKRVDINDIRVGGGVEWTGHRGARGFIELAYVFDREIVFATPSPLYAPPINERQLKDTLMLRAGIAF